MPGQERAADTPVRPVESTGATASRADLNLLNVQGDATAGASARTGTQVSTTPRLSDIGTGPRTPRSGQLEIPRLDYGSTTQASDGQTREAQAGRAVAPETIQELRPLDKAVSIADHVRSGRLVDTTGGAQNTPARTEAEPVRMVQVDLSPASSDSQRQPDFIIKKDGTIEVRANPDFHNRDKLVVAVEQEGNQPGFSTEAQKQSVDNLVNYLSDRYIPEDLKRQQNTVEYIVPGMTSAGQGTGDQQTNPAPTSSQNAEPFDAIPQGTSTGAAATAPVESTAGDAPAASTGSGGRAGSGGTGGASGGGGGGGAGTGGDTGYGARQPGGGAGSGGGGGDAGYGARGNSFSGADSGLSARPAADTTPRVGRHQITADEFLSWLAGLSDEQIEQLIKEGKLPRGALAMKKDLKNGTVSPEAADMRNMIERMKSGQMNEAELNQLIGPDVQQQVAEVAKTNESAVAERITDACSNSVNEAKWHPFGRETQNGLLGCAASVSSVLKESGVANVTELSVRGLDLALQRAGWSRVDYSQRQPGDVIIGYRSHPDNSGGNGAHTGIVGETVDVAYDNNSNTGRWTRGAASSFNHNAYPSGLYVLRPPAGTSAIA